MNKVAIIKMKKIVMSKAILIGIICASLLGLIAVGSLSCIRAPVKAPHELIPENADLLAYVYLNKVLNDPDFQGLYEHIYQAIPEQQRPSQLPKTLENTSEMFRAQTGLDLNDFSEVWAFADIDYRLEAGYYWGLIVKGNFLKYRLLLTVGKLTHIGGVSVRQYKGYEIYTRQQEDVGITFLRSNTVVIAPTYVIEDVVNVEKGERNSISAELYDMYMCLPKETLCKCALRLSEPVESKIDEMLAIPGIPIDLTPIREIDALGAYVYKEDKIMRSELLMSFYTEDTAGDFADMVENLISTVKRMAKMIDIPELEAVLDKVNVNQKDQQVIMESQVSIDEAEALIDAITEMAKAGNRAASAPTPPPTPSTEPAPVPAPPPKPMPAPTPPAAY